MNILIFTGNLYPNTGNNAKLICKLIPYLKEKGHEVCLFSSAFGVDRVLLPAELYDVQVYWETDDIKDFKRKCIFPLNAKLVDPNGYSDYLQVQIFLRKLKQIKKEYPFDVVISTSEPYSMAVAASKLNSVKKVLYLMDPPNKICGNKNTVYRSKSISTVLEKTDIILTTPFIQKALNEYQLVNDKKTIIPVGFPMITDEISKKRERTDDKIRLLFCGWLYSDIRSPKYFLDIVSRLDDRFEIVFMGRECERLTERFDIQTKAKIITIPQQPYETALQAMADADILINIGNSVPVHMPSKTLEYINTGKPIVNFYKFDNCPTLYYTKRYPLALNLYEGDPDIEKAAEIFIQFCESQTGKTVERDYILNEFKDCTAEYIAGKIMNELEK